MTSLRSSVRPKSSKQAWGTILQPEFGMGHQKMTSYEVEQVVDRLYFVPREKESVYIQGQQKEMGRKDVKEMLKRLTKDSSNNVPESNRTQKHSSYKDMGVVNSYAWRGYN